MSSLLRSFASLYCQKLRSTTRLGPATTAAAAARFPAIDRLRFLASGGGAADARCATAPGRQYDLGRMPFFTWARWAIGSLLAAATPFVHSKWASFLRIQSELEIVKDTAEVAVEMVEEVAATAEVSSELAEQLPENGKLRKAAVLVEHASKEVAEEAHRAQDIIHKVDEIEEDVKAMMVVDLGKHGQGKVQHREK